MKHSPSVQTHQMEASHARVLLDTPEMEPRERVLVGIVQKWAASLVGRPDVEK